MSVIGWRADGISIYRGNRNDSTSSNSQPRWLTRRNGVGCCTRRRVDYLSIDRQERSVQSFSDGGEMVDKEGESRLRVMV